MICPQCGAETSEMSSRCEWCGAAVAQSAAPPPQAGPPVSPGVPPGPSPGEWYPHQGPPAWQGGPTGPAARPPSGGGDRGPWYTRPWPYVAAIILVIVVVGLVVVFSRGSKARPDMVVSGKPTLLDFYTNT
jgi:hypothetical protein